MRLYGTFVRLAEVVPEKVQADEVRRLQAKRAADEAERCMPPSKKPAPATPGSSKKPKGKGK